MKENPIRITPHWLPEGWRLLWAGLPHYLAPDRRRALVFAILAAGVAGAAAGWFLGSIDGEQVFFALLGAIVLPAFTLQLATLVFRRIDRRPQPVREVFVTDSAQRERDAAIRSGSLIALTLEGRAYLVSNAEQARKSLPGFAIHYLISAVGWLIAILFCVVGLAVGVLSPSVLLVPAFFAALETTMLLIFVRQLGATNAILRAEERAVQQESAGSAAGEAQ